MGIRFYCPNGHKLNVKTFQAGQKGICPVCGVKMQIPLESTRPSSRQQRRNASWKPPSPSPADGPESLPAVSDSEKGARFGRERREEKAEGGWRHSDFPTPHSLFPAPRIGPFRQIGPVPVSATAAQLGRAAGGRRSTGRGGHVVRSPGDGRTIWPGDFRDHAHLAGRGTDCGRHAGVARRMARLAGGPSGIWRKRNPVEFAAAGRPALCARRAGAFSAAESLSNARRMLLMIVVIGTLVLLGIIAVLLAFFGGHR